MIGHPWALVGGAFGSTLLLTVLLRRWLIARRLLDHPNERSSHSVPVPRGGGIAFVAVICGGMLAASASGAVPPSFAAAAIATLGIAGIGFVDDVRGASPAVRLLVHIACAALAMRAPASEIAEHLQWGTASHASLLVVLAFSSAWCVNMFNFMDGIDGIAAMEGTFVLAAAGAMALLCGRSGAPEMEAGWGFIAAGAAVAGFLAVNISRWRIFMGDAGSGALGLLAAWALATCASTGLVDPWAALILPACFSADACSTLMIRLIRGESPTTAHRTHTYQRINRRGARHGTVTMGYTAINLFIVLPSALAVQQGIVDGPLACFALHGILVIAALAMGAGREPTGTAAKDPRT
jgi:Fuc2NAc and GlcNAc transferase